MDAARPLRATVLAVIGRPQSVIMTPRPGLLQSIRKHVIDGHLFPRVSLIVCGDNCDMSMCWVGDEGGRRGLNLQWDTLGLARTALTQTSR